MANPSLQIGNNNWAIKEDNLLGYSTAGTRFVPQPITMTRATLGTRVNPQGLVEDVELLGSELVTNGDFATDSDWTKGTGWTISGGKAIATNTGVSSIFQNVLTSSKLYKVSFTISSITSGSLKIGIGINFSEEFTVAGTYTYYGTPSIDGLLRITPSSGTNASIDNVSGKEVTRDNLPRVDYTDGTSSLLVEPQRTNLITQSENFLSYLSNATQELNSNISPSGMLNASNVYPTTSGSTRGISSSVLGVATTEYTISIFAKSNGKNFVFCTNVSNTSYGVWFDLSNGSVSGSDASNAKIISYGNDWYRLLYTSTSTSTTIWSRFLISETNGSTSVTANGTDGVLFWGAQLEEGSYPTSYIPTSGSTVTRVQETYTKTGISDKINSEEGVLFIEASTFENGADCRITLSDGTITNRVSIEWDILANTIKGFVGSDGNLVSPATYNQTNSNKIALKYKENDCALWINGTEVDTDFSVSALSGINQLEFSNYGGTVPFEGKVKQLQVFKTADIDLATLTS